MVRQCIRRDRRAGEIAAPGLLSLALVGRGSDGEELAGIGSLEHSGITDDDIAALLGVLAIAA